MLLIGQLLKLHIDSFQSKSETPSSALSCRTSLTAADMLPCFLPPPLLPNGLRSRNGLSRVSMTASKANTERPPPTLPAAASPAPNAGSQFAARRPRAPFFEGWYLRVVLPESSDSYAFMFSIEAPSHGTLQLLTPSDHLYKEVLSGGNFHASPERLYVTHWAIPGAAVQNSPPQRASELHGYNLSDTGSHGRFGDADGFVQWAIDYQPLLSYGPRSNARHTATWLSNLQIFEPGYQVLIAHGTATGGYIDCDGCRVDLTGAVVYSEKNWGRSFPSRWWWVQANAFWDVRDLSVLAVGARRKVLFATETVGIIAVHYHGQLYEFANWTSDELEWDVREWGQWNAWSVALTGHTAKLEASAKDPAVAVLGPSEEGMIFNVRDCSRGTLTLTLRDADGAILLDRVTCNNAQVEVGGEWDGDWKAAVEPMPWLLRWIVNRFNGPKVETTP